jgi:hypothetical protein
MNVKIQALTLKRRPSVKDNLLTIGGILIATGIMLFYFKIEISVLITGKAGWFLTNHPLPNFFAIAGICIGVGGVVSIIKALKSEKYVQ